MKTEKNAQPHWKKESRSLLSLLLFAAGVSFVLQSWELGWMITASLGIHEVGHVFGAWTHGIDWELGFGTMGAWTITPRKKRQALSHFANSRIHLAGPLFNFLYALIALGINALFGKAAGSDYWCRLANLSALLGVLNVIPMGGLSDGGKFAKKLFASLEENFEKRFLWALVAWPVSLLWLLLLTQRDLLRSVAILATAAWFIIHMFIESRLDNPADANSPKAMHPRQAIYLLLEMGGILLVGTAIVSLTPFWITEQHAFTMVYNLASILAILVVKSPTALKVCLLLAGLLLAYKLGRNYWRQANRKTASPPMPSSKKIL